jgi:hypothetical protein
MRTIILVLLLVSSTSVADSGSAGSGSAGSGSAGSDSTGSDSPAGAGSGSANAPAPVPDFPMPAGVKPTKVCLDEMDKDPEFADYIIQRTEKKLAAKINAEQVLKDQCTLFDHTESQKDVATNKRHVLMAYIAMWLVAAGFILFMWRKQQGLKAEIAALRRDMAAATKDLK